MLDEAIRRIREAKRTRQPVLDLSDLDLTELTEEICELTWLTKLNLTDNRITTLPESIGDLGALAELNLFDNRLTELPESFGRLRALTSLDLDKNRLSRIPDSIGDLTALTRLELARNDIEEIPATIGRLTALTKLNLDGNDLRSVPESIGNLTRLTSLTLSKNDLKALPESLGDLTGLTELTLDANRLTSLPESIGNLTGLTNLNLEDNRLTRLPDTILNLTGLTHLNLDDNRLAALPDGIGLLTNLINLACRDNELRSLPESIGDLTALERLSFWDNDIEALPESIGNLANLTEFDPSMNRLASLPESIGNLTRLTQLDLIYNRLTSLPETIGNLAFLLRLHLTRNRLVSLPDALGGLTALTTLNLGGNLLTALPDSIGNLTKLTTLDLSDNELQALPEQIAELPDLERFSASDNLLPPEMAAAEASGGDGLMTFLKEVAANGVAVREAKLVLVGEGAVGKSTLLSAMLGEPFEADRSSTHGIEVRSLTLSQGTADECVLNTWDFGGQETYRPTHQLFFTAPAVYLVVWKPRHGPRQDNVEEWIELIRRRAGDDVRVHVVATHGGPKDRFAHIDENRLRQVHGDVIVGFHHVDSSTGTGIEDLKAAVQRTASGLPYFSRKLPASWRRLQDDLHQVPEPYLEYRDYLARAAEHGLTEASAKTLATVATDLGHWCYYPDIPGLDQLVVLKGDWLSTAVSLVLDDARTVLDHGLVEHARLKEIWNDPTNPPHLRYPEKVHRVLLRLMEEYEISYRVGGGGHGGRAPTSLIAQLVDPSTPSLEAWRDYGGDLAVQTRICKFSDASDNFHIPEGLIYRLIVRLHSLSLGRERYEESLHWTGGLVIDHGLHGRALIKLDRNRLMVSVKAVVPDYLLTLVIEEIKSHVAEFWQGVKVRTFVSCGGNCNDPDGGQAGQWEMERLFNRRLKGKREITCGSCDEDVAIQDLLSGVVAPIDSDERFETAVENLLRPGFAAQIGRRHITNAETCLQDILQAFESEAADGPRLLTLSAIDKFRPDGPGEIVVSCRVNFWCEYSRQPTKSDGTRITSHIVRIPEAWLDGAGPWCNATAIALAIVLPNNTTESGSTPVQHVLVESLPARTSWTRPGSWSAEQARTQLRDLHNLVREQDPTFGGLVRVRHRGRYMWVHPRYEAQFNPGLPDMGDADRV
ncbi:COR domain-containing protein [Glycomyces sp. NPDC047010]|uniref:leucine-rich repeat domain-containing protein n=1 Tax=Glycomyces sp. NPDC047010 TaxID=3155023 RepID=UPI0033C297A3